MSLFYKKVTIPSIDAAPKLVRYEYMGNVRQKLPEQITFASLRNGR